MYSDVDIVKQRTNIVDIVGEYVKLIKSGNRFKACCPFHQEKTPSFNVDEDKQFYHCFGCGKGGDVINFVMEIEGFEFRESLEFLAEKAGVTLHNKKQPYTKNDDKKNLYDILEYSTQFYEKQLWEGVGNVQILPYIYSRGLTDETIKKFRLGFALDGWNYIEKFLTKRKYAQKAMIDSGMLIRNANGHVYDRFRNRITFPIFDAMGKVVGFTTRVLPQDTAQQAKYLNTPETILYHKSSLLYGLHFAKQSIKYNDFVVVVEGNMDVIASHEAGIENVVAVSGTAMTQEHVRILKRYTHNFVLFFDADNAGIEAARRSAIMCLQSDIIVSLVILTEGKDAADIVLQERSQLQKIIDNAPHVVDVFCTMAQEKFDTNVPHQKRKAVEFVAEIISAIVHDIEREEWIKKCAHNFSINRHALKNIVDLFKEKINQQNNDVVAGDDNHKQEHKVYDSSQLQRVYQKIILMMMAFPQVWKFVCDQQEVYKKVLNQGHIMLLIREGPVCNYSIGIFIKKHTQSESLYTAAMKMKHQYDLQHDDGDPVHDTQTYIAVAQDVMAKNEIDRLMVCMQKAEEDADYESQKKLLKEITLLSQQINTSNL